MKKEILTREMFMELMSFEEGDEGMLIAEDEHNAGATWFEIAKQTIIQLNYMLSDSFK